ncbi:MAG: helix-turn-helix transcriptional regulator [Oscillatoriales cyanobacterium C42_A2020_001]|nr:helix-turn-helix transcriptional regulator [Leptolyngbyaceae cyanobacterium C42_A2020_001]
MLSTESPLNVDYSQESATALLLPHPPLLTSYQSGWRGIQLAHHRQPAWELPELSGSQHIIAVPTPRHSVAIDFFLEGRLQSLQYHPSDYASGCIEIFPAELPYKLCWQQEAEFIHCYLEPAFLAHIAHETVDPDQVELILELRKVDLLIYQVLKLLKAELEVDGVGDRVYVESLSTTLAAHLLRHYSSRNHILRKHEGGLSKWQLHHAIEYINEHLSEDISLAAIAAHLGMSQYYFCRLFKQSLGITPHQYLIQQRVERAKQLLKRRELNITEIALECGFVDQSHLAKSFRQYTGISPKQFRQK